MNLPDKDTIAKTHTIGFKGLFIIYEKKKFSKSIFLPSLCTITIYMVLLFYRADIFDFIVLFIDVNLAVIPNLLGFILGGYAIIIGFGNEKFLKSTAKITDKEPISFYQKFSSVFALSLLSLSVTLIVSFLFDIFTKIQVDIDRFENLKLILNNLGLISLIFVTLYSYFQLPTMILNIFDVSQMHHINMVKDNIEESNKNNQKPLANS